MNLNAISLGSKTPHAGYVFAMPPFPGTLDDFDQACGSFRRMGFNSLYMLWPFYRSEDGSGTPWQEDIPPEDERYSAVALFPVPTTRYANGSKEPTPSPIHESRHRKTTGLEPHLLSKIKGQDHAISRVCSVLERGQLGLQPSDKPLGAFLFHGPTGVGKTELTLECSRYLFGNESVFRFDMSEFLHEDAVKLFMGDEADRPGLLGQILSEHRNGILLFDEIEKAHRLIWDLFLQMLDAARITPTAIIRRRASSIRTTAKRTSSSAMATSSRGQRSKFPPTRPMSSTAEMSSPTPPNLPCIFMKPTLHQTPSKHHALHPVLGALLSCVLLCALPGSGFCEDPENLLKNGAPADPGMETKVPGWAFQKGEEQDPGTIVASVLEIPGGAKDSWFFSIKKTTPSSHDHVWWRQDVVIESDPPPTYELTFEATATGDTDYGVYAGVAFIGADGSFEFHNLATVSREAPNAKLIPPTDWREFRTKFTPPTGTIKVLLRFGMDAQNPAECGFRNIVMKALK